PATFCFPRVSSVSCSSCLLSLPFSFLYAPGDHRDLHSFPTRRSSDLVERSTSGSHNLPSSIAFAIFFARSHMSGSRTTSGMLSQDRKSTRLNSSHVSISYAVFCLKKKRKKKNNHKQTQITQHTQHHSE